MRETIVLIDYIGDSTFDGIPVGHPINIAKEYKKLIGDSYEVKFIAPSNTKGKLDIMGKGLLFYAIRGKSGIKSVLRNYLIEYKNLQSIRKTLYTENVWFYNTDYLLFLWLFFTKRSKHKVICSTYVNIPHNQSAISKFIKHKLLKVASKKIDLFVYSNKDFECPYTKTFFMPDYLYCPNIYKDYRYLPKKEKAVSVGTISSDNKEILELIDVFNELKYPLEIAGKFYDEVLYQKALEKKNENIIIRNIFVEDHEYYRLLAEAKFSILPYRLSAYNHKTSAVILESIFLNSIPVAPSYILDKNDIDGIFYESIQDLKKVDLFNIDIDKFNYKKLLNEKYSETYNSMRLKQMINDIGEL